MNFRGEIEGVSVMHTGLFLTAEEQRSVEQMSWPDRALGSLTGQGTTPADRVDWLCRAYGLPPRDDGARWAYHPGSRELLYAWPDKELTPTVSATFADGSTVTVHDADVAATELRRHKRVAHERFVAVARGEDG